MQNLQALCRKGVRSLGDDDPGDEIDEETGSCGKECEQGGQNANECDVPAIVKGEAGADSGDHSVFARAHEFAGVWVRAMRRRRGGRDGGSTGRTEAGGGVDLFAAFRTEHGRLRKTLFCHRDAVARNRH